MHHLSPCMKYDGRFSLFVSSHPGVPSSPDQEGDGGTPQSSQVVVPLPYSQVRTGGYPWMARSGGVPAEKGYAWTCHTVFSMPLVVSYRMTFLLQH